MTMEGAVTDMGKRLKEAVRPQQEGEIGDIIKALSRSQAMIEFNTDGTIISANENFLNALGYELREIEGKHHRMFCDEKYVFTNEYKMFWEKLSRGEFESGEFQRFGKGGKEVWIRASYNPILDSNGKVYKVVKFALDITKDKIESLRQGMNLARIQSMMENAPINVMLADLDLKLVYINPKSRDTLRSLEKFLPKSVDQLVGQSIDIFHKNPEHQRKMLADDRKLPHRAKIKVGDQILDLLVSAIYDNNKKYLGPMVTWDVITDKVNLVKTLEETANQLAAAAEELSATATQLSKNAELTSNQSTAAATNTEEVSKGVQTVATNTEEMVASIKEISRNSSEAANISKDTLKKAQGTNQTITQLGSSSQEIGNVIKVISSIAQQTNLLALNATIEAARAGDAGKGFAVVANEVKELAKQTAKATEDITNRIGMIQKDTQGAVDAIGGISQYIEKLNGISISIAASIEEQTATTNEVARVVKESNKGVDNIASVVKSVATTAKQSSSGASQTLDAARSLAQLAEKLNGLVKSIQV